VKGNLGIGFVGCIKSGADNRGGRAPVFVNLEPYCSGSDLIGIACKVKSAARFTQEP
jgi:hypothetical protein